MINVNNFTYTLIAMLFLKCDPSSSNNDYQSDINHDTQISIHKENELIYIQIDDYPEIAGFQFDLYLSEEDDLQVNSLNAFGGISEEANFTVSTGLEMLRVLGFNLNGETIDSVHLNSNKLVYLDIQTNGSGLIGLQNVIISGENGYNIPINVNPSLISIP